MRQAGLVMLMAAMLPVMGPARAAAEDAWIRVEAKRGAVAEAAIAGWREKYDDVQVFALPGGMTGIALGPLDAAAAAARMAQLKAAGEIPADSYLTAPGGTRPLAGVIAATGADAPATDTAAGAPPDATADTTAIPSGGGVSDAAGASAASTHIQLQATPGRISADEALARWQTTFPEAGLWRLASGMFVVALPAQSAESAAERLAELKAARRVPSDAYLATSADLGQPLVAGTPAGGGAAGQGGPATGSPGSQVSVGPSGVPTEVPGDLAATDTPGAGTSAAGASTAGIAPAEATPSADQPPAAGAAPAEPPAPAVMPPLDEVQRALRWAGFYDGPIDGKSGPGTRAAIDREIEATSPGQPQAEAMIALLARRAAWREEIGLARLDDQASGLGLLAPVGRLAFDRVERGLSIYGPKDGSGAALILSRQPGGQQEMLDFAGLVTALGWVPKPEREAARGRITLTGADAEHAGHAEARVADGQVEGWVLIWPAADADNARRLAIEMGESFGLTPVASAPEVGAEASDPGLPAAGPAN